ncbi:MAG: SUMF1/EgtB/PvdO family nonheme iron enzyme [Bryobacteraceae bacterium]
MPPTNSSPAVFLSYSRADREACIALRAALEQVGVTVFRDEDSTRAGDRWITRLEDVLLNCSAFVILVGRDGVQRWVGAELQIALTRYLSAGDDTHRMLIFPVLLDGAKPETLPPFLALFQAIRWLPADPVPGTLIEAIVTRAGRAEPLQTTVDCPFLGLNAFGREDAKLFFGRRRETLEALSFLGTDQQTNPDSLAGTGGANYHFWLQIEGNSGAGKSSLVNAGMLPMIEQGALWARTGFERWRILGPMMPGREPTDKLAEVLERTLVAEPDARDSLRRVKRLREDERALAFQLREHQDGRTGFLLVLDQFEELFTFAEYEQRRLFDALLAAALQDPECPLFVISTIRADFLDRLDQLPRLQSIYNSHCRRYFLPVISEQGLREIIEEPARLAGLDVHDVTAAILNDARDEIGALPLVENALLRLWQHREGNRLSAEWYLRENGIAGMLRASADALLDQIQSSVPKGRMAALELLLRLTRVSDDGRHSRQRITREEAAFAAGYGNQSRGEQVLRLLSGERPLDARGTHTGALRLVTIHTEQGRQYVDLIHETLIRARGRDESTGKRTGYWPALYDYVEENRDRDLHWQQLKYQAELWARCRGLTRFWKLAYFGLGRYRKLRVPAETDEGRFLSWSRWARRGVLSVMVLLAGFAGQSLYWAASNDLPLASMVTLQRFRMGYQPIPRFAGIPPGSFDMGEHDMEYLAQIEGESLPNFGVPNRRGVQVAKGFRLSQYEITYDEYDFYVWQQRAAGNVSLKYPTTAKGGRGLHPVVNVNWWEAANYAKWLGLRTRQACRLPTEVEWEYAARAGTSTVYWWGDSVGTGNANCANCGSPWDRDQSAPVGSFKPNRFGLYDVLGNVWEWTCSAWAPHFDENHEEKCAGDHPLERRVIRGGSYAFDPRDARSGSRRGLVPNDRRLNAGFRVLCSAD